MVGYWWRADDGPRHYGTSATYPVGRPLAIDVGVVQAGRRTHRLEATMQLDGTPVARAWGLRVPLATVALPPTLSMSEYERTPPGPEARWEPPRWLSEDWGRPSGHGLDSWVNFADAAEYRVVEGTWDDPGECTAWIKVAADMIDGFGTTSLMRAVVAADMSAGIGRTLPFDDYAHPNADLNVHLFRYPCDEWVGVRALMWVAGRGVAMGDGELWDETGRIGRTTQACIVTKR